MGPSADTERRPVPAARAGTPPKPQPRRRAQTVAASHRIEKLEQLADVVQCANLKAERLKEENSARHPSLANGMPSTSVASQVTLAERKLAALQVARRLRSHLQESDKRHDTSALELTVDRERVSSAGTGACRVAAEDSLRSGGAFTAEKGGAAASPSLVDTAEEAQLRETIIRLQFPWHVQAQEFDVQRNKQLQMRAYDRCGRVLTPSAESLRNRDAQSATVSSMIHSLTSSVEEHSSACHLAVQRTSQAAREQFLSQRPWTDVLWKPTGVYEHFTLRDAAIMAGNTDSLLENVMRASINVQSLRRFGDVEALPLGRVSSQVDAPLLTSTALDDEDFGEGSWAPVSSDGRLLFEGDDARVGEQHGLDFRYLDPTDDVEHVDGDDKGDRRQPLAQSAGATYRRRPASTSSGFQRNPSGGSQRKKVVDKHSGVSAEKKKMSYTEKFIAAAKKAPAVGDAAAELSHEDGCRRPPARKSPVGQLNRGEMLVSEMVLTTQQSTARARVDASQPANQTPPTNQLSMVMQSCASPFASPISIVRRDGNVLQSTVGSPTSTNHSPRHPFVAEYVALRLKHLNARH